jgi:hypothetical protein
MNIVFMSNTRSMARRCTDRFCFGNTHGRQFETHRIDTGRVAGRLRQ